MKPLLMVMSPRNIPQCVSAISSLDIDTVWLKHWTERELMTVIPEVLAQTDHDTIGLISDDTIPTQSCLDLILNHFEPSAVYTGYCNLDDTTTQVNLSRKPLKIQSPVTASAYSFPTKEFVESKSGLFRSWFTGFAFTFMSKKKWLEYPFECYGDPGYQSDYALSIRLQANNIPIFAPVGAFMPHLKNGDENTHHLEGGRVLTGNGMGQVIWDI